ncbi:hypothetical protein EP7_004452 [Isosphaeraceae bacterium EP7]
MRRFPLPALSFACLVALVAVFFGDALFRGGQLAFRDSAHFYYPLYQRVEAEWQAGRWPLWEMEENSGMPLLGQPTAAVLYPGKLIYTVLPYAWGARLYAVAHVVLAFVAAFALARSWSISAVGSGLAGLSYAFAGPIVFQYCNIIFLVGAAWAPLGFLAVDRWLRLGRTRAILGLATVLAMQVLGGDPQASYLTGLFAGLYAFMLSGRLEGRSLARSSMPGPIGLLSIGIVYCLAVLAFAAITPSLRPKGFPPPVLPIVPWLPRLTAACWALVLVVMLSRRKGGRRGPIVVRLAGLGFAAGLAGALSAAQLLPVVEFTALTSRSADQSTHDIYPFSVEPDALVGAIWPNFFGSYIGTAGNTSWHQFLPPRTRHAKNWVPTLYMGASVLLLAWAAMARPESGSAPPWRRWLFVVAGLSFVAGLGEYGGPLWWARGVPSLTRLIGIPDGPDTSAIRFDGHLRDGDGSVYWMMTLIFPGFHTFRYPAKLLTFTVLALAILAGAGWDRVIADQEAARRLRRRALALSGIGLAAILAITLARGPFVGWLTASAAEPASGSQLGPLNVQGAFQNARMAFVHSAGVLACLALLAALASRRPRLAGAALLLLASVDLAMANSRFIATVPQSMLEGTPEVLKLIQDAEKLDPATGPFRIHRMPIWDPMIWQEQASNDRVADFVEWERATIQPKYGINYGAEYTHTLGTAELYDYDWFFAPFWRSANPQVSGALMIPEGERIVYQPRRGYDLWNTRYFVVPSISAGWKDENRGYASFVFNSDAVHPPAGAFDGPDREARELEYAKTRDYRILRNRSAYPRAWVVHDVRLLKPVEGMDKTSRVEPMNEILYADDPIWKMPDWAVIDPKAIAWIETTDVNQVRPFITRSITDPSEVPVVRYPSPQRVEIDVNMMRPGIVVLADVFYPGWTLTIDDKPAPILRANRAMRGAGVPSGRHKLVYTYNPVSFRNGLFLSTAALAGLFLGLIGTWFRPSYAAVKS